MNDFIVFNTESQANNFVKRRNKKDGYYTVEPCNCCRQERHFKFDGRKVLEIRSGETHGSMYCEVTVIGKLKRKRIIETVN